VFLGGLAGNGVDAPVMMPALFQGRDIPARFWGISQRQGRIPASWEDFEDEVGFCGVAVL
jgi:hypothetical protein